MCIIIGIVKSKKTSLPAIDTIKNAVVEAQRKNPNGSAVVAWKGKDVIHRRAMKFKEADILKYIMENNRIVFHFRIATAGSVKVGNCHLWEKEKWHFAHNGFTSIKSKQDHADSYEIMQKLWEEKAVSDCKVNLQIVRKVYRANNLTGKTIFVKPELDKMVMTGDYNAYGLEDSTLVFASGTLSLSKKKKIFGMEFEAPDNFLQSNMSGVNLFNCGSMKSVSLADYSFGFNGCFGGYNYRGYPKYYNDDNPEPVYSPTQRRLFGGADIITEMADEIEADEEYDDEVAREVEKVIAQQERSASKSEWVSYPKTK